MGKGHLTSIDVAASSKELSIALAGCRLTNIYDLSSRTYIFKFGRPGGYKAFLIVESGIRFHLTAFERETSTIPNPFAMKLRKHVRTKRFEGVRQCGIDRIIQITLGSGESSNHIFIELHSGGNIILTDASLTILSLLRPYETTASKVAVYQRYPVEQALELPVALAPSTTTILAACTAVGLPKQIVTHCLVNAGLDVGVIGTPEQMADVFTSCCDMIRSLRDLGSPTKGYLFKQNGKNIEFSPVLFHEHERYEREVFETFNEAMDAFFSNLESLQKIQSSTKTKSKALSKEDKMRRDLDQRIRNLETVSDRNSELAVLIEENLELVDNVITALRTEIAKGVAWKEMERMVAEEKQHGQNPIASCIKSLYFDRNRVVVRLGEDETAIEIDLSLSAHANANQYYNAKKKACHKSERTLAASQIAIKSARIQTQKDLKKAAKQGALDVHALSVRRKVHWFEKFHWFITSDNFLVVGGRDAQQNDMIVRRHLTSNDLYFHADLHGASSVILLNPEGIDPIPQRSLEEAAQFTVCRSAAWSSKAMASAYWVRSDQVSKTAPTGMYVSSGAFMIRGKRNYMPNSQLLLGFTYLFRVADECLPAHAQERFAGDTGDEERTMKMSQPTPTDQDIDDAPHYGDHERNQHGVGDADALPENPSEVKKQDVEVEHFDVTSSLLQALPTGDVTYNANLFADKEPSGRLTAKQRRQQKKGGGLSEPPPPAELPTKQADEKPAPVGLPRGKRSKLKKIKKKYADQDDVDRERALLLLGASSVKDEEHASEEEPLEEPASVDDAKKNVHDADWIVKICYHCHGQGHVARECPDLADLDKTAINKVVQKGQEFSREAQVEADDEFNLRSLTGSPSASDQLLYAIPMCAPYSAIRTYRFKVKVIPGNDKRGVAAKQSTALIMKMCQSDEDADAIRAAIKAVHDNDLAIVLPPASKVSAPGIGSDSHMGKKGKHPGSKRNKGSKKR